MFRSLFRLIRITLLVLLLLAVITFAVSNRGDISLSLYPFPFELAVPVFLFFLLTLALGYGWGHFSRSVPMMKLKSELKRHKQRIDAMEQELAATRSQQELASQAAMDQPKLSVNPSNG
jgi:uncharacterized integral membrane protein